MRETLKFIAEFKPMTLILENVLGLGDFVQGCDRSALQVILEQLEGSGYEAHAIEVDLAMWISVSRPRSPVQTKTDRAAQTSKTTLLRGVEPPMCSGRFQKISE